MSPVTSIHTASPARRTCRGVRHVLVGSGVAVSLSIAAACTPVEGDPPEAETRRAPAETSRPISSSAWAQPDPVPESVGVAQSVSAQGGTFRFAQTVVDVPAGVSDGEVTVHETTPIGEQGPEWFGQPAHIEHDGPLKKPITVTWTMPQTITHDRAATAVLVHYDPDLAVWEVADETLQVRGRTATAELTDFSFYDVVVDIGQGLGELTGNRVDEPKRGGALPSWVDGTVDPDEDLSASAIRVCFEPDKDEKVTVRVANNRTFTQRLTMENADYPWAWTWTGDPQYDAAGLIATGARLALDTETSFLLPPTKEVAVGVARPDSGGAHFISAEANVDLATLLVDAGRLVAENISMGGADNPAALAALQAIYECGGKQFAGSGFAPPGSLDAAARSVVDTIGSCASEIVRPKSAFGARFESLLQAQIRARPEITSSNWAKSNRFVHSIARKFQLLQAAGLVIYASDQWTNAVVGPLSWSIRGRGTAADLADWSPQCNDPSADSDQLYRNLTLRDEFSDTSLELWESPAWASAASQAVSSLLDCDRAYRGALADLLPSDWDDPVAAGIVATAVRVLDPETTVQEGADASGFLVEQTGQYEFTHPLWGKATLATSIAADPQYGRRASGGLSGEARIAVYDVEHRLKWVYTSDPNGGSPPWYEITPNDPPTDRSGNIFLNYNPGRYNGAIVLRPTQEGFEAFGSLPDPGDYDARWYYTELVEGTNDLVEIAEPVTESCTDCAGGFTITGETRYAWTGDEYSEK